MPKNRFFRHISGIFGRKNIFSKIRLHHILNIIILRQCAKFHEKISSTNRDIQEILFFRRKLAVPAIFRQFRLRKSVFLTIETCLIVGIAIKVRVKKVCSVFIFFFKQKTAYEIQYGLVGSEMCIRDRLRTFPSMRKC